MRVEGLISAENEESAIRIEQGKKRYAAQKEVHDGSTSISGRPEKRQAQGGSTSVCGNAGSTSSKRPAHDGSTSIGEQHGSKRSRENDRPCGKRERDADEHVAHDRPQKY